MSLAESVKITRCLTPYGDYRPPNLLLSVWGDDAKQALSRSVLLGPPRELVFQSMHYTHTWIEVCPGHFATYTLVNRRLLDPLRDDLIQAGLSDVLLHEPILCV